MGDIEDKLEKLEFLLRVRAGEYPEHTYSEDFEESAKQLNLEINEIIYKNGVPEEIRKRYENLLNSFS